MKEKEWERVRMGESRYERNESIEERGEGASYEKNFIVWKRLWTKAFQLLELEDGLHFFFALKT